MSQIELAKDLITVRAILALPEMGEFVLDSEIITRMGDEFKVSPHGLRGDFDTDCYWIARSDAELALAEYRRMVR
jgi:hypothetical protein